MFIETPFFQCQYSDNNREDSDANSDHPNVGGVLSEFDLYYEKIRKQLETIFYNYDLLSKSLIEIGNTFDSLEQLVKRYNMDNNQAKEVRLF